MYFFFLPQITIAAKCFTTYFISTLLILNALSIILRSRGGGGDLPKHFAKQIKNLISFSYNYF